jgi:type VI protein secretion system component VasK
MSAASLIAASTPAIVWLAIGLVTVVALLAMTIALVRHAMLVGRTAARFRDEITPITEEIDSLRARASRAASDLQVDRGARRR